MIFTGGKIIMDKNMIIVVGASASGKTAIAKILYQKYGYKKCITTTTRSPRLNEVDGRDYRFVSKKTFEHLLKVDAFVEVTQYHEHKYGLQKKDVLDHGVVILDPNGANHLNQILKNFAYIVFVESSDEERRLRMLSRGDDLDKIKERLKIDNDFYHINRFDKINLRVVNENEVLEKLAEIIYKSHQTYIKSKMK